MSLFSILSLKVNNKKNVEWVFKEGLGSNPFKESVINIIVLITSVPSSQHCR